jgi:NADH:ubiquinone oxidoreductase subunit E
MTGRQSFIGSAATVAEALGEQLPIVDRGGNEAHPVSAAPVGRRKITSCAEAACALLGRDLLEAPVAGLDSE